MVRMISDFDPWRSSSLISSHEAQKSLLFDVGLALFYRNEIEMLEETYCYVVGSIGMKLAVFTV